MPNNMLLKLVRVGCSTAPVVIPMIASAVEFTQVSWYDPAIGWHEEYSPSWSPGADSIVAESRVLVGEGTIPVVAIWPVPQDGSHTFVPTNADSPSWSPDGRGIAVTEWNAPLGIWIYWRSGGQPTQVTTGGRESAWHPDGTVLAYSLYASTSWDLWQVNRDTGQLTQLTSDPFDERTPSWSPDRTKIAFASNRTGNWEIWIHDTVTGSDTRLTNDPSADEHPSWSPTGRWIAFASTRSGNPDIWIEDLFGILPPVQITTNPAADLDPAWSPDGTSIAFSSDRSSTAWGFRIWIASDLGLPDTTVSTKPMAWSTLKGRYRR